MKIHIQIIAIAASFMLVNCGGGGTSSPPINTTPPPPPPVVQGLKFNDVAPAQGLQFSSEFSAGYMEDPRHFAGGAAAGDIDGDGDIDLFIVRGDTQPNLLYINSGGSFTDNAAAAGLALPKGGTENYKLSGPTFADLDGDKDLDLFVGGLGGDPSYIFSNDGTGVFSDVTTRSGIDAMTSKNTLSAAFGDYDKDGDLDLAMSHWGTPRDQTNPGETETLWRNDSDASGIKFTPVSAAAGIVLNLNLDGELGINHDYTFAPNFADINEDGYPDLVSVSDFRGSKVFVNNQDGTFTDVTDTTQISDSNGMGAAVGDYDNDGDLDWFVSSIDGNRLYNNMAGTMIGVSQDAGIELGGWGWGSCFADFDRDGHLDIYQTNGWINNNGGNPNAPYTEDKTRLWMSDGLGAFTNEAFDTGIEDNKQGRGVVCADFDNDRDTDVLLLLNDDSQAALLWNNTIDTNNAIAIDLQGPSPNTQAIGTRIYITNDTSTQMREIGIGSNFTSHNPTHQLIGLGSATTIDELKIVWPDGIELVQNNVAANQSLTFTHPDY